MIMFGVTFGFTLNMMDEGFKCDTPMVRWLLLYSIAYFVSFVINSAGTIILFHRNMTKHYM